MVVGRINNSLFSRVIRTGVVGAALRTAPMIAGAVGISCGGSEKAVPCTLQTGLVQQTQLDTINKVTNMSTGDNQISFDIELQFPASGSPTNLGSAATGKMYLVIERDSAALGMNDSGKFAQGAGPNNGDYVACTQLGQVTCSPFIGLKSGDLDGLEPVGYLDKVNLPAEVSPSSPDAAKYATGRVKLYKVADANRSLRQDDADGPDPG
jgi:hypothetical protein